MGPWAPGPWAHGSLDQWVLGPVGPWAPLGSWAPPMGSHGPPPWDPMGPPCFGLFGPPIQPKILKIRPLGYFFMLHSMAMLPDLEIPLKSQKISKNRIPKKNQKIHFFFSLRNRSPGSLGPPAKPLTLLYSRKSIVAHGTWADTR